ncbi:hypothetical protein RJT34_26942 [Clitoria ternatea]|uniref:Uncharacterized protein n=1 Tax=Clitoria ternatea TaxID=43366 RepID=A0AAN9I9F5_CLITE
MSGLVCFFHLLSFLLPSIIFHCYTDSSSFHLTPQFYIPTYWCCLLYAVLRVSFNTDDGFSYSVSDHPHSLKNIHF